MARLDFGKSDAEAIFMLKATVQSHEHLLLGSAEEMIDGVVPTVNDSRAQMRVLKNALIALNAIVILLLGIMTWRNETRQPIIIYQPVPQAAQPQGQHKSYTEAPQMQTGQVQQDSSAGQTHW